MDLLKPSIVTADDEIDRAVATLALAFAGDPVARWIYPDAHSFIAHMPALFGAIGAPCFAAKTAYRTDDGLGVTLWLPPGGHGDDETVGSVVERSIPDEQKKGEIGAFFEQLAQWTPAEPHWYLSLIGVEPLSRNKGLGSLLLRDGLEQCDRDHRIAYLWSSNPSNIPFYEKHGFRKIGQVQTGSSPIAYPMIRVAR